jgi:uncharacterized protein YwqG
MPHRSYSAKFIENRLQKLVKEKQEISLQKPRFSLKESQTRSHFLGLPYFEEGEGWPRTRDGRPMDFIFQIVNENNLLPKEIKILQFYYDWKSRPWFAHNPGWLVKSYPSIETAKQKTILNPAREIDAFIGIGYEKAYSLPDWQAIGSIDPEISEACCQLAPDRPWSLYAEITGDIFGADSCLGSWLGGYPAWLQGNDTPANENGQEYTFLMQVDSEEDAGLMWSDMGLVYLFMDPVSKEFYFCLQSM